MPRLTLLGLAITLAFPAAAGAATTVGQTFTPSTLCTAPVTLIQVEVSGGTSYTVPSQGVITSWSHYASAGGYPLKLKVARRSSGPPFFTVIGESGVELTPGVGLVTYPTRVPVEAGDLLGMAVLVGRSPVPYACKGFASAGDGYLYWNHDAPVGTSGGYTTARAERLDISARVEPDADRDGFGDETQDACPTNAATQGACPEPPPPLAGPPASVAGVTLAAGACANPLTGSAASETLNGSALGDRIIGLAGDDVINGLQGDDCLFGGDGKDKLDGAEGDDALAGETGADILSGGVGKDVLGGGAGNDKLSGGSGEDSLLGGSGKDKLSGGAGDDKLSGGAGDDSLSGGQGKNRLSGGSGDDVINAVDGKRETVSCGGGRDTVRADARDTLRGCERAIRARG